MKLTLPRLLVCVFTFWVAAPFLVRFIYPHLHERGQFGDLFGSINALFSGLAFAGLFWSLRTQQEQLELQRNELGLQREELRLQREEMAASRTELARQVRAQEALFHASLAQIRVAEHQAEIEALKVEAVTGGAGGISGAAKKIRAEATKLNGVAESTESRLK